MSQLKLDEELVARGQDGLVSVPYIGTLQDARAFAGSRSHYVLGGSGEGAYRLSNGSLQIMLAGAWQAAHPRIGSTLDDETGCFYRLASDMPETWQAAQRELDLYGQQASGTLTAYDGEVVDTATIEEGDYHYNAGGLAKVQQWDAGAGILKPVQGAYVGMTVRLSDGRKVRLTSQEKDGDDLVQNWQESAAVSPSDVLTALAGATQVELDAIASVLAPRLVSNDTGNSISIGGDGKLFENDSI